MFESAVQPHKLDKAAYALEEPKLQQALIEAQVELAQRKAFSVIVLVTGTDGAGKGKVIQRLYEWLDPRHLQSNAYDVPTDEERLRPRMWRYWRDLPPKGDIGVVFGSWYNDPLNRLMRGDIDDATFERELGAIERFERMLADEGALILKFLLMVSPTKQKRRLAAAAEQARKSRHVLEEWSGLKRRKRALPLAERAVRRTSTGYAPWVVIPSDDPEYRDLTFGQTIARSLRNRLDAPPSHGRPGDAGAGPEPRRSHGARHAGPVAADRARGLSAASSTSGRTGWPT